MIIPSDFDEKVSLHLAGLIERYNHEPARFKQDAPKYLREAALYPWENGVIGIGYVFAITLLLAGWVPTIGLVRGLLVGQSAALDEVAASHMSASIH